MASSTYVEILERARALTHDEQRLLVEELTRLLQESQPPRRKRSILEFRGLGKEVWKDVDVEKYIDEERNSWDG